MSAVSPAVQSIADQINALTPAAQLRLAADLIEARKLDTALILVERIALELRLVTAATGRAAQTGSKAE